MHTAAGPWKLWQSQKPWRNDGKQSRSMEKDGVLQQRTHRKDLYNHQCLVSQQDTPDSPRDLLGRRRREPDAQKSMYNTSNSSPKGFSSVTFSQSYTKPAALPHEMVFILVLSVIEMIHSIITFVFKDGLFSCRFMFRYA